MGSQRVGHDWHTAPAVVGVVNRQKGVVSRSVVSDSLRPHVLQPSLSFSCPWNFPGKITGLGCPVSREIELGSSVSQILYL